MSDESESEDGFAAARIRESHQQKKKEKESSARRGNREEGRKREDTVPGGMVYVNVVRTFTFRNLFTFLNLC